jgi:hypothetical protein
MYGLMKSGNLMVLLINIQEAIGKPLLIPVISGDQAIGGVTVTGVKHGFAVAGGEDNILQYLNTTCKVFRRCITFECQTRYKKRVFSVPCLKSKRITIQENQCSKNCVQFLYAAVVRVTRATICITTTSHKVEAGIKTEE